MRHSSPFWEDFDHQSCQSKKCRSSITGKSIAFVVFPFIFLLITIQQLEAQLPVRKSMLQNAWDASWITHPDIRGDEFGVYLFQKTFDLKSVPERFIVHVSADNRYKLYINGRYVCNGPTRGDLLKWRFETVDIRQYLQEGPNIIGAIVWNFAELRPIAQISKCTGLILEGDSEMEKEIMTDETWRVFQLKAYKPLPFKTNSYYAVGPGEEFDARLYPWDWSTSEMTGPEWKAARKLHPGTPIHGRKALGIHRDYLLSPREIPFLEETEQQFFAIRKTSLAISDSGFVSGKERLKVPANTKASFLLDQSQLTTAYPVLEIHKGKDAEIKLTYAESLFNPDGSKGNRNEIEGKTILGNQDIFIADGGNDRVFQPLWWRTFRYVEVQITTKDEPLEISNIYSIFTAYPFQEKASFSCNDPLFSRIWKVGWHTQRLCAGETYFDTPYYEQLQYIGDTRIQALISYYLSGDDRLMRKAINDFYDSQLPFKLTQSRYPSRELQVIAPFSLYWIMMVYDYWMLQKDDQFIRSMIPAMIDILQWYEERIDTFVNLLGHVEWWNFTDWVSDQWKSGEAPGLRGANSSVINLQYVYAIQLASRVFDAYNMKGVSDYYQEIGRKIQQAVIKNSWDSDKNLIADTPEKKNFSQHANIMGILTGVFSGKEDQIMEQVLSNRSLAQCSYYYSFYLAEALRKAGMAYKYPEILTAWKDMLDRGLTTFAERNDPTRSDCHAWSASPLYFFLSMICGIEPAEPGFKSVRIEPQLGRLKKVEASMPHRLGDISMKLNKDSDHELSGKVILPEGLTGTFIWKGKQILLNSGENEIAFSNLSHSGSHY